MSNITVSMVPSHSTFSVLGAFMLQGGYACADARTFAVRERITGAIKQLPGTQVWSPPT